MAHVAAYLVALGVGFTRSIRDCAFRDPAGNLIRINELG